MSKEHHKSGGNNWVIDRGTLHLYNVSKEIALFWYDNVAGKPHPNPDFPLDEIMNFDFDGVLFDVGGFLKHEPWAEWKIYSNSFKIEIKEKHVASS